MPNHRTGLHKEIASIFDGVPIPKDNGAQQASAASAPKHPGYAPPPAPQAPTQNAAPVPKPQQSDTSLSKPQQPAPPLSKPSVPDEQPQADVPVAVAEPNRWLLILEQIKGKLLKAKPGVNPSKQKTMLILVPVLSVILIVMFSRSLITPVRGVKKPQTPDAANTVDSANNIDWQIPDPYPTTLRDPMRFSSVAAYQDEADKPVLKGIIYSDGGSSAVIGNQIVREGEKILNATVVKINRDSVEFEMNGKKWFQKVQ